MREFFIHKILKLDLDILPIKDWLPTYSKPLLIAGPCSAESEEQMLSTGRLIAQNFPNAIFRAGIWKPRTRPNTFEGIGDIGLEWLKKVKQDTGMLIATEVATSEHVEKCLKAGVDILWIGARTTVNPFSVQDIADVLKGVDIPVFVKNPIYPDAQLWAGALERINNAGIKKIAAIHRGFHSYDNGPFRNSPKWELAIDLKAACPQLPVICDPSHIGGNPELIPYIAQKAMDMDMDGLMIETHINPKEAWTDAAQQLRPSELKELLAQLIIRKEFAPEDNLELEYLRQTADNIDSEIIDLLSRRMEISAQMGEIKRQNNITAYQPERWREILDTRCEQGNKLSLDKQYIAALWQIIHDESIKKQLELPEQKPKEST